MKIKQILFPILFLTFLAFFFNGCEKDPCDDVNCNNGGCNDGRCICEDGYDGQFCDQEIRAKFLGNWTLKSNECDQDFINFAVEDIMVSEHGTSPDSILISFQFGEINIPTTAKVTRDSMLILEDTQFSFQNFDVNVSGEGKLNTESLLTMETKFATILTINCVSEFEKI